MQGRLADEVDIEKKKKKKERKRDRRHVDITVR